MKRCVIAVAAWLICSVCAAQITVPAETPEYTPIPVSIKSEIPEGAQTDGPGWIIPEGVNVFNISETEMVVCAPPGVYTLQFKKRWLHIVPVTFVDGSGKEITIMSYLGSGDYDTLATFMVTGEVKPDPPKPPVSAWGLILEETADSNPKWGVHRKSLRLEFDKLNKRLLILDETKLPPSMQKYAQAVRESKLPLPVLVAISADGQVAKVVSVPATVEGVKKELGL